MKWAWLRWPSPFPPSAVGAFRCFFTFRQGLRVLFASSDPSAWFLRPSLSRTLTFCVCVFLSSILYPEEKCVLRALPPGPLLRCGSETVFLSQSFSVIFFFFL